MSMIDKNSSNAANGGESDPAEERSGALWTTIALNFLLFYAVVLFQSLWFSGAFDLWRQAPNLGGPLVAVIAAIAVEGWLNDEMKTRVAFLSRGQDAARRRLDPQLGDDPAARAANRAYAFFRDYACFALLGGAIFAVAYIALILWSPMFIPTLEITAAYFIFLVGQFVLARRAAAKRGARLAEIVRARSASLVTAGR